MNFVVPRTCTELFDAEISGGDATRMLAYESKPLSAYRSTAAFVLLGDPGAGKSTEFDQQSRELGDAAQMVSARDFIGLDPVSHPEWRDRILFIDGLDEMRAGRQDSRLPLDEIRNRLDRFRPPGFRISCREADWLGHSDRQSLQAVSPDSRITVLRLDELDDRQVIALLRHQHNRTDEQAFITEARNNGVGGLLVNPLTLRLLVDALRHGGDWPDSRLKTLEMACRQIATEHNQEHRIAKHPPPLETIVDAAGYLCALQLLAGVEGYLTPPSIAVPSFICLSELGAPPARLSRDDLKHAIGTKLFRADREGFVALHRQVAEFLAGQHLANLIDGGLPARRVVALMTSPSDDRVVTSLRGLSAWLAAHSREARPLLVAADPVGVGLYGDIESFRADDRRRLLESLSTFFTEASLLDSGHRDDMARAFRPLASADMVPSMKALLKRIESAADEELAALILDVLSYTQDQDSVADLGPDLERVLIGNEQSSRIRRRALDAYLQIVPANDESTLVLRLLLDAIQDGSVADPDAEVRGGLLEVLYPEVVTPSEVWRYALGRNRRDLIGDFWWFWHRTLLDKSSDRHLVELLDSLHEDASRLIPALEQSGLEALVVELLARCLEASGDNHQPAQMYDWLATASGLRGHSHRKEKPMGRVRAWLEARPQVQKEIVLTWLRQSDPDDVPHRVGYWYCEALHSSTLPPDFGLWCLDRAIEVSGTEPEVAQALLRQAYGSLQSTTGMALTPETLRERTRGNPALAQYLDELCAPRSSRVPSIENEHRRKMDELERQWDDKRRQEREDWAKHLHEQEAELRENRFWPRNLDPLAMAYLGEAFGGDRHESPKDRIGDLIGGDPRLVDAVMAAIRGAVSRDDLPEVDQTVSWSLESKHSWLAFPVLASLDLLDKEDPTRLDGLQDAQKRKALATYYCVPRGAETPPWHDRWLQQDPEMVLDVLYRCAVAAIRAGQEFPPGLNDLDGTRGHNDLVHAVRLRLLEAFPTRSSNKQSSVLNRLLTRALDFPDKTALLALAERKQASKSMPIAQQIRWWATDALIVQGTRLRELKADLAEREIRVRHLAEFLRSVWDRHGSRGSILADIRDPSALRELIEILGRWCAAPQYPSGFVTLEMEMTDLISRLIGQLGSEPGDAAKQALEDLVQHLDLEGWHPHLIWAQQGQRVVHRDASYSYPGIEQVQGMLNDGPPANPADLKALLVDRLSDMCDDLRGGNTDIWRQFWNEDRYRLTASKPEDSCRDALLTNLKFRLPAGVDAAREGSYAANTRSDIRASHDGFNVPIEIKKDCHTDLWKAMRNQLMAKYTTDPATEGYGIYLVLWFADLHKPVSRNPDGIRPSSPGELRRWLEQDLSPEEARKISVVVMDVTKPGDKAAA